MILPLRVFGSSGTTWISRGLAIGEISRGDLGAQFVDHLVSRNLGVVFLQDDERADGLPGVVVGGADHRRLGHAVVSDERGLHLGGGDPVTRNVHHVVDAAQHPDLAVAAVAGAVTGEVPTLLGEPRPVGLLEPLRDHPRYRAASTATACPAPGSR